MKIKVTKEFQMSELTGVKFQAGNQLEVSDNVGRKCIKAGVAVEVVPTQVKTKAAVETAALEPAENAMLNKPSAKNTAKK